MYKGDNFLLAMLTAIENSIFYKSSEKLSFTPLQKYVDYSHLTCFWICSDEIL